MQICVLLLNFFILLNTVLQVLLKVLFYYLKCIFVFVALDCFGLLIEQLFLNFSDLILFAIDISARNLLINQLELFQLDLERDVNLLQLRLSPTPLF
jgi:hypothetical protein